jgi:hypothetical protein
VNSRDLAVAGRKLAALRAGAGGELAAASAARPWGDDAAGRAFEQRYRSIEEQVLGAWEQLAGYLERLGEPTRERP